MKRPLLITLLFIISVQMFSVQKYPLIDNNAPEGMKHTAFGLAKNMGIGWCLGCQLEAEYKKDRPGKKVDYETNWGNPKVTKRVFEAVKEAGFGSVRIPIRWYNHCDADMNVDREWLDRVRQVVDMAYQQGLYVIINTHHESWYDRLTSDHMPIDELCHKFNHLWKQIATEFKDYDEHLLFAGVNEVIRQENGIRLWGQPTLNDIMILRALQQTFINTVRETGGNNKWRNLIYTAWSNNAFYELDNFHKPTDHASYRLMFEFHSYSPWHYCAQANGDDGDDYTRYFWGSLYFDEPRSTEDFEDELAPARMFASIKSKFIDQGIPAIMGEFGASKAFPSETNKYWDIDFDKVERCREDFYKYMLREGKNNGIVMFYWDNNYYGISIENLALFDRNNDMKIVAPNIINAMKDGYNLGKFPF